MYGKDEYCHWKKTTQFSFNDQLNLCGTFLLNRGYGGKKMFFILIIVHSTLRHQITAIEQWNMLGADLKKEVTVKSFRRALHQKFLINQQFLPHF